jgi:hypothetical protein
MLVYSNPRMSATIENWPSGSKRVTAKFEIEAGYRWGSGCWFGEVARLPASVAELEGDN